MRFAGFSKVWFYAPTHPLRYNACMQYHYFIGFYTLPELDGRLHELQHELYNPEHMVVPLTPHITLVPPPAVLALEPHAFAARLKKVAAPFLPMRIDLTDVDVFHKSAVA